MSPDEPTRLTLTLPWYFGVFIAVVWLAVMTGLFYLGRHLLRERAERKRQARRLEQGSSIELR